MGIIAGLIVKFVQALFKAISVLVDVIECVPSATNATFVLLIGISNQSFECTQSIIKASKKLNIVFFNQSFYYIIYVSISY